MLKIIRKCAGVPLPRNALLLDENLLVQFKSSTTSRAWVSRLGGNAVLCFPVLGDCDEAKDPCCSRSGVKPR
jgi:hypothetical protein